MIIQNESGYAIPAKWLPDLELEIAARAVVTADDFRGETHLYCFWYDEAGELIDHILGPGARFGDELEKLT